MADSGFPLPGSSYKELIKIVQGYGQLGKEGVPSDVAKIIGVHETIVSKNNRFLVAVGIVQGTKKKTITALGAELAGALQHDLKDEVSAKWRNVAEATDFLQKVVAAVRIRKGMDESSLESHVAYSAGQPKTPAVAAGAGAVVEILKVSGLLKEEGGNLLATAFESSKGPETVQQSLYLSDGVWLADSMTASVQPTPPDNTARSGGVQLSIQVRVQCTPQDLDGLGEKLRNVLRDFNQPEARKESARENDQDAT
jgi:hypothetical protein